MELMQFEKQYNVKYLTWVSDFYDPDLIMKNFFRSVEINYLAESQFNEEIVIKTSEEKNNGLIFNHSVFRSSDGRELCRIRIEWSRIIKS